MFTGIIEELGVLKKLSKNSNLISLEISAKKIIPGLKHGDSVAVNGVCLTVRDFGQDYFAADVMAQTARVTSLNDLALGDILNLERALRISDGLDGHIVQGHVDGLGVIKNISKKDFDISYEIGCSREILKFIINKGSIAIDGISLTVSDLRSGSFMVSLIPTSLEMTNLKDKKNGDRVNLEVDMISKYIYKFVNKDEEKDSFEEILRLL